MFGKLLCRCIAAVAAASAMLVLSMAAHADVFDMGGTRHADGSWIGLASLRTVTVGNLGNTGELSGEGAGGYGPDHLCGAVHHDYKIGKYEVTAGQYCEFLNAVASTSDTYGLYNLQMWSDAHGCKIQRTLSSGVYTYSVAADRANRPVNYVSWGDAARFANWLHNDQPTGTQNLSTTEDGAYYLDGGVGQGALMAVEREPEATWFIPSEDEWYKAAYHRNDGDTAHYFDYPTNNNAEPSNDLTDPDGGNNANFFAYQDLSYTLGGPYWTTVVGDFENSESPYGTFDQGGNVFEWNETIVYTYSSRGARGGYWGFKHYSLTASHRVDASPHYEGEDIGFRVACVPEPGGFALLVCGAIAGMVWWRRRTQHRGWVEAASAR